MKLWKKIVLIASTLIVIISSMVLPCFAGTYYSGGYEYTQIDTIAPEITWYTQANTLTDEKEIYSAVFDTGLITDQPTRQSQSWRNKTSLYRLRNSTATEPYTTLKHLDIYNTETIQGHILSTYNITQIGNANYSHISDTFLPFTELTIKLNNYVFDGLQNAYIYIPDHNGPDYKYTVTYEAERIVFNRDTGEVYTESANFTRSNTSEGTSRYIYFVRSGDMAYNNVKVIQGGESRDYQSEYMLFKSISIKIEPLEIEDPDWTFIDEMSITIPSKVTYTTSEAEQNKRYVNPNDIDTYEEALFDLMKEEGFFKPNQIVTANFSSIWTFLTESIGGFFDFEIIPNISIGEIFATIFIILIGIVLLKVFAGG